MNISTQEKGNYTLVSIAGEINRREDAKTLKNTVQEIINKGVKNIGLNLKETTYLDSGGINIFSFCYKLVSSNIGKMGIIAPNSYIRSVVELVGIEIIIPIYTDETEFVKELQKQAPQ